MEIKQAYQMEEIAYEVRNSCYDKILAYNLRKFRMERFKLYKLDNAEIDNPYSIDNISSLLNITRRHYARLENPSCSGKNITLDKLLILSKVYDVAINDFFKKDEKTRVS